MFDYSEYIQDRTSDFTGREWVFRAVDNWLGNPDGSRFFLITGEPGSGKSAIAARLKQFSDGSETAPKELNQFNSNFIRAAHFCSARDRRWINPHTFTESLALQLSALYPEYAKALAEKSGDRQIRIVVTQQVSSVANGQVAGVIIKNLDVSAISSPEDAFIRVVREPIEALFNSGFDKSVIILVDALDETFLYGGKVGIAPLLAQSEDLPERVRFILTSRRDERVENEFLYADGLFLSGEKYNSRNFEDIEAYVRERLKHDEKLSSQAFELPRNQVNELVITITGKADGNFQYVRFLLDSVAHRKRSLTQLEGLPEGLDGLYHNSVNRLTKMAGKNWLENFAPVLGLLSVAQENLTFAQIQSFTGQTELTVWSALGDLQQFIEERTKADEKRFGLYHQSFIDFLHRPELVIKKKTRRNSYYLPPGEWHGQIANYYWKTFHEKWQSCDPYGLHHLVNHIQAVLELEQKIPAPEDQTAMLYAVVLNKEFQYARRDQCGDISGTLTDLRTAIGIALNNDDLLPALRCIASYRDRIRTESITKAIFDSVSDSIYDLALEKGNQYQMVFSPFGWWSQVLQFYIAWEAAETGNTEATLQAIAGAERLSWSPAENLCNALLVRCARVLSQEKGNERSAGSWLEELVPNCNADLLLTSYKQAQVLGSDQERQALLSDLDGRLRELEQLVAEGDPEAVSMVPFINEEVMADKAANLKDLLVKLAADSEGQKRIDRVLEPVLTNPYPRYRDIALVALGLAVVAIPDPLLARRGLQKILSTALDYEGVSSTFDLPAIFLAEAERRNMQSIELSEYLDKALKSEDRWGTAMRARSAHAAGLYWQGEKNIALNELKEASQLQSGFAGYATVTQLSLAIRCFEFGFAEQISDPIWGSEKNASLLEGAMEQANLVRDQEFRHERINLVEDYKNWLVEPVPYLEGGLKKLSTMPNDDFRNIYIAYLSAQWSRYDNPYEEGLKALVPMVLGDGTTLDTVLARLFGPRIQKFTDEDLSEAISVCAQHLTIARPWKLGQWR